MTAETANEKLTEDLKSLIQDAEALMKATSSEAGERLDEIRGRLAAAVESAKASCQWAEERTRAAAQATDQMIRDHPYESIGVAFGVGLLVGLIIWRR
jgi:ElaB/YqjD/DUF883 family membrane-anchored ribosome-binding protein